MGKKFVWTLLDTGQCYVAAVTKESHQFLSVPVRGLLMLKIFTLLFHVPSSMADIDLFLLI